MLQTLYFKMSQKMQDTWIARHSEEGNSNIQPNPARGANWKWFSTSNYVRLHVSENPKLDGRLPVPQPATGKRAGPQGSRQVVCAFCALRCALCEA